MESKKLVFKQLIQDFIGKPLTTVKAREQHIPDDVPKIVSLLGPRRAGKTYMLFYLARQLRQTMPANRIVYINFEDDRLFPLELHDLDALVQSYYELFPENKPETVYFLLDEVQVIPNWELFVRRIFDQEQCRVYLTGSSSKLLSRELATSLRGRTLPFEVFPLSFPEFLQFQDISESPHSSKGKAVHAHQFQRYLQQGGFPELVFLDPQYHARTIQEYIDLMIFKDLTERFQLKNPALIRYLLKYLLNNIANPLSFLKVYQDLQSQGLSLSKNTVYEYFSYLEEAFVLFQVKNWTASVRKQVRQPVKVYGIDPAYKHFMSIREDAGRMLENVVFLHLRARGQQIHYWQGTQEVDFVTDESLINVSLHIQHAGTRSREIQGLLEGMTQLGRDSAWLLTMDERETIREGGKTIEVMPVREWMMES